MQTQVAHDYPEGSLIEFTPIRDPEIIFIQSYEMLVAMGIRHDIAQSLASYSAFNGEKFNPKSVRLENVHEEIGQEPQVKGRMAA